MRLRQTGSIFVHGGSWYYSVRLPGEDKRHQRPLRAPGSNHAIPADRPRKMAEEAAARLWADATRQYRVNDNRPTLTVDQLCTDYLEYARTYYRHADGSPTSEVASLRVTLSVLRSMYGRAAVCELTHRDMLAVRDANIRSGICRKSVNDRTWQIRRMMTWALDEGRIPASVKAELTQVAPLKRGRSEAHETDPVRPVDDHTIDLTVECMMPNTADMVRVHRLTGMRPGEMVDLRWSAIDRSTTPWIYRPGHHKNSWRGNLGLPRVVLIGPKAREILMRHYVAGVDAPFSPAAAVRELMDAKRAAATSPSHQDRRDPHAVRVPGNEWRRDSYTRTVAYACKRAGIPPWGPNRLRHAFATEVRRRYGLEACRAVLGHSAGSLTRITDRYSFDAIEEEMIAAAAPAVEALG